MNSAAIQGRTPGREAVAAILEGRRPDRFVYGPNYWQWFEHHRHHGLPPEIAGCQSQLDLIRHLGLDVFSRNVYCDQQSVWFGGLSEPVWTDVACETRETREGRDRIFERVYRTRKGTLTERLRYVLDESTLVQDKYLVEDPAAEYPAFAEIVRGRRWRFVAERYHEWEAQVGTSGCVIAGELFSPLKMLHFAMNPIQTCYFLADDPDRAAELTAVHEEAMLDLARQIAASGAKAMMSMDNLDTQFHSPTLVERYSASFYEQASRLCHEQGSRFFIHACGQQRANLPLIASLGVDGLEGVAFPSLGDVELDEAMRLSGDRLIITGGISALEYERLKTREAVFAYVRELLARMAPYAHRFVLAASCTTPYSAPWDMLRHFRDAWLEYGAL